MDQLVRIEALIMSLVALWCQALGVEYSFDTVAPPAGNLTCHACVYSVDRAQCMNVGLLYPPLLSSRCRIDEHYCMVERYMTNGVMSSFMRGCAKECVPGCHSAGRSYVVQKCYSCCQRNYCNQDNGGVTMAPSHDVTTGLGLFLILCNHVLR